MRHFTSWSRNLDTARLAVDAALEDDFGMEKSTPPIADRLCAFILAARGIIFGTPHPERLRQRAEQLPQRVTAIIRHEQETSEILISLVQIGAIVFFFLFYAVSPKAFPADVPFEPIPVALAIYGAFTLLRCWRAVKRTLTPLILTISVVVDIAVLMVTIWSFHLQYQSPPEMYLKAPTLMYVFIMIALRSLRFEPFYVLIAGISAALGWLVLVIYAVYDGDDSMITHSFATYVTSHSVLIGAEVDKIVSILMVTAILALGLLRARKLLYRSAAEQQAAADLSRFFAPEVAGRIRDQATELVAGTAELRQAAILFIDMRGFTRVSADMSPSQVMGLLSDYQALMVASIRRHGGSIDKFMGDGILASFGATSSNQSFAADGARCIEAALEDGERWRVARESAGEPAPRIAAALTTGTVMFGTVGDEGRLEYTVLGEPVNLAAKLEKHCKVEGVSGLMPAASLELAGAQGFKPHSTWKLCRNRHVEGIGEPLDLHAYRLD